jgi:hypothetical protein
MNFGYSSRLDYDDDAYIDKVSESTYSSSYRTNQNQIYNNKRCMSTNGPRSGFMGHGVSVPRDVGVAPANDLVEIDSIFSNRNAKNNKSKRGYVNHINPINSNKLFNSKECTSYLDTMYSKDTHPASNYRDSEGNRFVNLIKNPQDTIFENFSVNSRLEAKDNYVYKQPLPWPDLAGPEPNPNVKISNCLISGCSGEQQSCPKNWTY